METSRSSLPGVVTPDPTPPVDVLPEDEWARDWLAITDLFAGVEFLTQVIGLLDLSYVLRLGADQVLTALRRFAWSLQHHIVQKYGS